jgi:AraC-like DNA-binding protein
MSVSALARAAILACPGHWTPATLSRQLRVDVAELEPALASMQGLQRGEWRGELSLPAAPPRGPRYRPYDAYLAALRRLAGHHLTLGELAGALECSPRHAASVAARHGARCAAVPGTRGALWRVPDVVPDLGGGRRA